MTGKHAIDEKDVKKALKKDFKNLYVQEFTTDWKAQRLLRVMEIDIMSLENTMKLFEVIK
jgi:hypothetical protein